MQPQQDENKNIDEVEADEWTGECSSLTSREVARMQIAKQMAEWEKTHKVTQVPSYRDGYKHEEKAFVWGRGDGLSKHSAQARENLTPKRKAVLAAIEKGLTYLDDIAQNCEMEAKVAHEQVMSLIRFGYLRQAAPKTYQLVED